VCYIVVLNLPLFVYYIVSRAGFEIFALLGCFGATYSCPETSVIFYFLISTNLMH